MKLPVKYKHMSDQDRREWLANRIQHLEQELEELKHLSRKLATGKVEVKLSLDDRPDLVKLKLDKNG
jgi:hypothetical protein